MKELYLGNPWKKLQTIGNARSHVGHGRKAKFSKGVLGENLYLLGVGVLASLTAMALISGYVKLLAGVGDPEPFNPCVFLPPTI